MTKDHLIQHTIAMLSALPQDKVSEIADFADYIFKKYEDLILQKGIEKLASQSKTYEFLHTEEALYTLSDLKEVYK